MSELDDIRAITNNEPAPATKPRDSIPCPACGSELTPEGVCKNEACENHG